MIEEGALADVLLVDGDPLATIDLVADPGKNFLLIMKDGKIFKNSLLPAKISEAGEKAQEVLR